MDMDTQFFKLQTREQRCARSSFRALTLDTHGLRSGSNRFAFHGLRALTRWRSFMFGLS